MENLTLQIQHRKKSVTDNEVLERYFGKQVFFEETDCYSGKLTKIGETFLYFTDLRKYHDSLDHIFGAEYAFNLEESLEDFKKIPDMTINKNQIERIVLTKDILKRLRELKREE